MRILVIGGRGFYGGKVVEALGRLPEVEVQIGGRRGPVVVDLAQPESFSVFNDFDVMIGCQDSVSAAADEAVAWCVRQGKIWLDLGADGSSVERMLATRPVGPGLAVLGVGLFPGLSTALAVEAAAAAGRPQRVEIGIRLGALSGAGRGICNLMVDMLNRPSVWFLGGQRLTGPALGPERVFGFLGSKPTIAQRVGLPDAALVHAATGAPDVAARIAIRPGLLRPGFALAAALVRVAGPLRRPLLGLIRWQMLFLRAFLLRRVPASVQITAVADPGGHTRRLACPDGQWATAIGVAAAVACLQAGAHVAGGGLYSVGAAFPPDALLAQAQRLEPKIQLDSLA